jgi:alpha-beta hydrolase superfamily lysophospholipase
VFVGFDLRGHGNSEGKRGHIPSYQRLLEDVDIYLQRISEIFPGIPLFLYGHSMGGNITLGYAVSRKPRVTGVVVSAPWLRLVKELPGFVKGILRPFRALFPGLQTSTGINPVFISRDEEAVKAYRDDPLIHDRISLQLFFAMNDMGRKLLEMGKNVCCPLLLMHSKADPICDYEASKRFADNNAAITFKTWDNLYHEIHNEPEKEEVFEVVYAWMESRLKGQN